MRIEYEARLRGSSEVNKNTKVKSFKNINKKSEFLDAVLLYYVAKLYYCTYRNMSKIVASAVNISIPFKPVS